MSPKYLAPVLIRITRQRMLHYRSRRTRRLDFTLLSKTLVKKPMQMTTPPHHTRWSVGANSRVADGGALRAGQAATYLIQISDQAIREEDIQVKASRTDKAPKFED
jgi:hypothetical protein